MYLRAEYQQRFPNLRIDVLNRGKGGEEAVEELLRFRTDIFLERPSLVIWQVGTNAVFHKERYDLDDVAAKIAEGLERLRVEPMDVVLMDPQYVTALLVDDKADVSERMVALISAAVTTHYLFGALVVANLPKLYKRFGVSAVTKAGCVALAAGIFGWAMAEQPWQLCRFSSSLDFGRAGRRASSTALCRCVVRTAFT